MSNDATSFQLTSDEATTLETLIDRVGLSTVVEALALICGEKAEHLRANWQDNAEAKVWDKKSAKLSKFAAQLED